MEREAFASLFSQPQRDGKKKSKRTSSAAASPRKHHVDSFHTRSNKRPRCSAASPPSSSSASASAASSPPAGSRFVECPLCGKSVHSSLAQSHVERCVGREDDNPVLNSAVRAAPLSATTAAPSIPPSSPTGVLPAVTAARVFSSPPAVGGKGYAGAVVNPGEAGRGPPAAKDSSSLVVDEVAASPGAGTSGKKAAGGTPVAGTAAAAAAAVSLPRSAAANSPSSPAGIIGAGSGTPASKGRGARSTSTCTMDTTTTVANNAFAKLMAASALTNFREEMYLWAHEDGTLSWGWGTVGNPLPPPPSVPPAKNDHVENGGGSSGAGVGNTAPADYRRWSCQVATKGPDGRKAGMCDLWTNLPPAQPLADAVGVGTAGRRSAGGAPAIHPAGSDENAGLKAARPQQSLSRLPVAVIKSMLQKNVRRGRAAAAVRCALELALKSWNDAIRRVLVIIVEDSLLHPAAPLLTWLMVATSKGYRPPHRLLEAFLCVVYETAACPVRDSTESSRRRRRLRHLSSASGSENSNGHLHQEQEQQSTPAASFDADEFSIPHPHSLLRFAIDGGGDAAELGCPAAVGQTEAAVTAERTAAAAAAAIAVANIRRALLMRVSYGGMVWDQALLKGACLAWGERCGHLQYCCCCGVITPCSAGAPPPAGTPSVRGGDDCSNALRSSQQKQHQPPEPPLFGPKAPATSGTPAQPVVDRNQRSTGSSTTPLAGPTALPRRSGSSHDNAAYADGTKFPPLGYAHESVVAALRGNGWTAFLVAAHGGTGMPPALRSELLAHVANGAVAEGARGVAAAEGEVRDARDAEGKHPGAGPMKRAGGGGAGGRVVATATSKAGAPNRRIGPVLREADAILSGVDFHCSGVLDELLRSTAVAAKIGRALLRHRSERRSGGTMSSGGGSSNSNEGGDAAQSEEDEVLSVRQAAKKAMWACSSGLNVRRLRVAFRPNKEGGGPQEEGACEENEGREEEGDGVGTGVGGSTTCRCRNCHCSSSPGFLEEVAGAAGASGGNESSLSSGCSGSGDGCSSSCDDADAKVWAAMSADVCAWARAFVRGRLARG